MIKVEGLQDDVNKFKITVEPIVDDSRILVKKLNNIFGKVEDNLDVVTNTVEKVRDTVDSIIDIEQRIQRKIEVPLFDSINSVSAIFRGVKVFFERIKSPGRHLISKTPSEIPEINNEEDEILFDDEIQEEFNDINKELNEVRKKLEEMKKV